MLLNLQMDFAPAQEAIAEAQSLPLLTSLSASPALYTLGGWVDGPTGSADDWEDAQRLGASAADWGLRLVENVLESQKDQTKWTREAVQALLTQEQALRAASAKPIHDRAAELVPDLVPHELGILESIGGLLERAPSSFASAVVQPDDSPLRALMELFTRPPQVPTYWAGIMDDEEEAERASTAYAKLKTGAAHTIVGAAADDENLAQLCPLDGSFLSPHWFVDALVSAVHSSDAPAATCALLALGNLARDGPRSEAIARMPGLLEHTVSQLAKNDVKMAHAAVGLLKNLAIPTSNKVPVFASGVLLKLVPLLSRERDMIQPLQFGVVGLLRQLSNATSAPQIALGVLGTLPAVESSPFDALVALRARSDHASLRLEIARVNVALIRAIWSARANDRSTADIATFQGTSEAEAKEALSEARAKLQQRPVLEALVDLLRYGRKHAVLMSEGLLALSLASSASTDTGTLYLSPSRARSPLYGRSVPFAHRGQSRDTVSIRYGSAAIPLGFDAAPSGRECVQFDPTSCQCTSM